MGVTSTTCLECGAAVSLIAGVPLVRDGVVGLRCRVCPEPPSEIEQVSDDAEVAEVIEAPRVVRAPRRRMTTVHAGAFKLRRAAMVIAAGLAVVAATGYWARADHRPAPPALRAPNPAGAPQRLAWVAVAAPEPPPVHALTFSLTDEQAQLPWVHPIAVERELPTKDDRRFGAERPGHRPAECGAGHCGVDLGRERGAIVHAALGGRIIRVKRDAGSLSGRYVAIEHPQGLRTRYMHLDRIHPDLVAGMEIASGEAIGVLGATGIQHSPPHLHFAVQRKGDSGWQYVDPEPMLTQAIVLDAPAPLPEAPDKISRNAAIDLSRATELSMPPNKAASGGPAAK